MNKTLLTLSVCTAATLLCAQDARFQLSPVKKLIKFGWDAPTPSYLLQHFDEIEKNMIAYDGMGIEFNSSTHRKEREKGNYGYPAGSGAMFFSDWKWDHSYFTREIEQLKEANAKFKYLKYNFINTNSMAASKDRFDWFDDKTWDTIVHNFALMAAIARETGCRGLNIDIENYERQTFLFNPVLGRSYAETWDKARQRGREFIKAIAKEYPDIVLHTFFWLDQNYACADGVTSPYVKGEKWIMGLTIPFLNGIYDAMPETVTIVEGMESSGYRATEPGDYQLVIATRTKKSRWLIDPKNYEKYWRRTQLGMATYLDRYIITDPKSIWFISDDPAGNLKLLQRNLTCALAAADEYAWTWSEGRSWYTWKFSGWMEKACNNIKRPGPLWEDALPGITQAILYAKNPQKYYRDIIEKGVFRKNLIRNPKFGDSFAAKNGETLPPEVTFVKAANPWGCWQDTRTSQGTFSIAADQGRGGSNAAKMQAVRQGCILQSPPFSQEGAYFLRARVRTSGTMVPSLSLGWLDDKGRWNFWGHNMAFPFRKDLGDGWKEASALILKEHFPPPAKGISVQIGVKSEGRPEDVCWVDEVEFYNLNEN
ncbi:MAG: hypothetical protein BWY31_01070 [Lentisphaerae bacterium ADurb.Bin242]|nr:MAG: hypothetical protein BWY31_01070 [Lentisphaerae bacterium ADurb.Bin242]